MSLWVIPYIDQDLDFWQDIAGTFGPQIRQVYFPMPGGVVASGRPPQPDRFIETFLRSAPLPKAVLVNPIVLPRPVEECAPAILQVLAQLYDDYGVAGVTVSSLALAACIRQALPQFHITASVLMGIVTPAQALMVRDWVDTLVPDSRLIRDLNGLRRLREAFDGEVRLIVNEACLPGCPYRVQHFYEMGYSPSFPRSLCDELLEQRPWLRLTGAWILPRHLACYEGLYDSLKLAGRATLNDPDHYRQVLGAYVRREAILPCDIGGGPASVLEPIDVPDEWFERTLRCDKNCGACLVCRDCYEQALAHPGQV